VSSPNKVIDLPTNLRELMVRLRDPGQGCPWDLEQDFASIAPYTLEEAYEVADAISRGNLDDLCEELGDLWLQVVFHAQMAEDQGAFNLDDVEAGIVAKMIRRHPHVFGAADIGSAAEQTVSWESIKAAEKAAADPSKLQSRLGDIPVHFPALMAAAKLGKRASRVGFDWPDTVGVWAKLDEELTELRESVESGGAAEQRHELGDVLFSVVNLARHLDIEPERALREANTRFVERFEAMDAAWTAQGNSPEQRALEDLEADWQAAKRKLSE